MFYKLLKQSVLILILLIFFQIPQFSNAEDYVSPSFILRDPVITSGGSFSSSSSFKYFSSVAQTVIGESSSSNFSNLSGFLYFSVVSTPIVSITPDNNSISLSWTPSVGSLGVNITAYEVGVSTISGSGYSYTNVGGNLSHVLNGLTNDTTYYVVVRALDFMGDSVVMSSEVSATPSSSGGGGSGGGSSGGSILTPYVTVPVIIEFTPEKGECFRYDFNCDTLVDIVDFSILIHWFDKNKFPKELDLNEDGLINIVDFSILVYYWTDK